MFKSFLTFCPQNITKSTVCEFSSVKCFLCETDALNFTTSTTPPSISLSPTLNLNNQDLITALFHKRNSGFFPSCIFSCVKGNCVSPCFSLRRGRRYTSPEYIVPSFMIMLVLVIYFSIWAYKIFNLFLLTKQNPSSHVLINRWMLIVLCILFLPLINHFCPTFILSMSIVKLHFLNLTFAPDSLNLFNLAIIVLNMILFHGTVSKCLWC